MIRMLPGSIRIEGRIFMYLEYKSRDDFMEIFPQIGSHGKGPLPKQGGMLNEKATIETPDGKLFHCISFKGDLEGWKRVIIESCESLGIIWGEVQERYFTLSTGRQFELDICKINIEER